ncbi:MAG TPA: elongation factor P [Actinomycetota bacterium]|nr:elongation factor P [Actinomycetota bacterium]
MAETVNTNDLRRGMIVDLPEGLFQVIEFQHHKPGKGQAVVRTKVRNVRTGAVLDRTFNSDTKVNIARLDRREMQYLYREGDSFVFMDNETYDQSGLESKQLGDDVERFLVEGLTAIVAFHDGSPITIELPTTVDVRVTKTDPGLRGDRQSAGTKPATVETGTSVQVPLFVNEGDVVRVDTRTGEYVTRVQS